jgi:hypothetical protein
MPAEIGGQSGQVGDLLGPFGVADRAADGVSVPEQFLDAVPGDEAGGAGDQDGVGLGGAHGSPIEIFFLPMIWALNGKAAGEV